jgi:beta-ribofuranosylaminobenzene 5'-phosphate synthase
MKVLPSIVDEDIEAFGEAINQIQEIGFKKIEVGLQGREIKKLMEICRKHSYGAGLSSFGPTIYCIGENEKEIKALVGDKADVLVTEANNTGATLLLI